MFLLELFHKGWAFALANADLLVPLVTAAGGGLVWLGPRTWKQLQRRKKLRVAAVDTFAFEVIGPNSSDVVQRIYGSRQQTKDDPLADFNIPYVQRLGERAVLAELRMSLERGWLLILGPTGLGKTREAAELAQAHSAEGWTVMRLQNHELLTVPDSFPEERLGRQPKLLFVLDNLNQAMVLGERVAAVDEGGAKVGPMKSPLQTRLLDVLKFYIISCGAEQVRVVATARNERNRPVDDLPSEWEKLGIEKYKELWGRFELYELPAPENRAVSELLAAAAQAAGIKTEGRLAEIAETNDRTFRNPVENLERLRNQRAALTMDTFVPTMRGTWESRYLAVRKRYGVTAAQLYDGVDLLRQVRVPLRERSVLVAAQMVAGGRGWQRWWQLRKLGQVLKALEKSERILEPRDGQIEAKGYRADLNRYFELLCQRLPSTFEANNLVSSLLGLVRAANERQNYLTALDFINRALQASDTVDLQAALFSLKGLLLRDSGLNKEAIVAYDASLALNPDYHEALTNKGVALSALGRKEEAITAYDAALALNPDDHSALHNKGVALSHLGRQEEAITAYDVALVLNPDDHKLIGMKGVALFQLGRNEEALDAYNAALALKPDDHKLIGIKGVALFQLGRNEEALDAYDTALALKPDDHKLIGVKGGTLFQLERNEEAITAYNAALAIKPDEHEALYAKGLTLSVLCRNEEAIMAYDAALALKPNDYEVLTKKGNAMSVLGRQEEAITVYDAALAINPDNAEAFHFKGLALSVLGRYKEAITVYDAALAINPDDHSALYNKGNALVSLSQNEEAIAAYDDALTLNPDYSDALYNKGVALNALGRNEEAILICNQIIKIKPNDERAWYNKACYLELLNRSDDALTCLQKAINLDSGIECIEMAKTDADFDNIRHDPRFQALITAAE
jgi:tetratricopeptide (TPR) repeat protein